MNGRFLIAGGLLFLSLFPLNARMAAKGIVVTDVLVTPAPGEERTTSYIEVTFNNRLKIRDITASSIGGRLFLKFPEYVSKKKRVYPRVRVCTRQAHEALLRAVETGKGDAAAGAPLEPKLVKYVPFRRPSTLKAFATVSFNDAVEVELRVTEGRNGPRVLWPSRKAKEGGPWIEQVVVLDKRLKEKVEQDLLYHYQMVQGEGDREDEGSED